MDRALPPIDIVGLHGGQWYGPDAEAALRAADVLIGHARQLAVLPDDLPGKPVELWGDLDEVLGFAADQRAAGRRAAVLAAGDPGFFGLVRLASIRLGPQALRVLPAPSSVALACARLATNWDDALVVSAHGRPLHHAVAAVQEHPKVAVLVSKDQPPQALGAALLEAGCGPRDVAVCSNLGEPDESVQQCDLDGLAAGEFAPLSVVVVQAPRTGAGTQPAGPGIAWGRDEDDFQHRAGMITKAEVRAVALGKLALPAVGVLWDVGAASGSVAIECATLTPGLKIFAIERRADDLERLGANIRAAGVQRSVTAVAGTAPEALASLPDPDRVFVGGGGLEVLDAVLARLRPSGRVVATYATMVNAAAAAERLGNLVQLQVSRATPVGPTNALRLAAENPVFLCWGAHE